MRLERDDGAYGDGWPRESADTRDISWRSVDDVTSPDWVQASDDDAADMYLAALERLDHAGFEQYEISNVARSGHISRHNVKYWQAGNWIGFGCGAHSTVDGVRWKNVSSTTDYVARVDRGLPTAIERQRLTRQARLEEALFTGLRLNAGIDGSQILAAHGVDPWERYGGALQPYVEDGLMWVTDTRFGLSRPGMIVANEILTAFV
jgi:oxygen-independent coproporphyrinogen-3 oxidase